MLNKAEPVDDSTLLIIISIITLHLLFDCGLELGFCFGQFFLQTFALLCAPLQLLLQLLQTCSRLLVSLILLMVKHTNINEDIFMRKNTFNLLLR